MSNTESEIENEILVATETHQAELSQDETHALLLERIVALESLVATLAARIDKGSDLFGGKF